MAYRTIPWSLTIGPPQIAASGRLSCKHVRPKLENTLNQGTFIKTAISSRHQINLWKTAPVHQTTLLLIDLQGVGLFVDCRFV